MSHGPLKMNKAISEGARAKDAVAVVAKAEPASAQPRHDLYGGAYGYPGVQEGSDLAAMVRQYLHLALKRKWLILSSALVFAALGGVRTALKTPLYVATVRVQIERESTKILEGGSTAPTETDYRNDFLRTQYQLLKSRAIAERVVSTLHLADDESLFRPHQVSLLGILTGPPQVELAPVAVRQEMAAAIVAGGTTISPVTGSRLVDISYVDTNPARAQNITNSYADAYIASNLDKRFEANAYAKTFLEDQIQQLKVRLEDSEKALLAFAEHEKMVEVTDKTSIAENNLAAANAALGQLISERMKNEQQWRQVDNASAINLPQLLSNSVIEVLRGQRKALETEYQEKLENFKPAFPAMIQISRKIKEVDRQLAAEVDTIRKSLKALYESSSLQEIEMKARIETLKAEVLDLQKKGIQHNILKREVDTNRGLYNNLLQRYKEVGIASGAGTNNIFVVERATMPGGPFEPNLPHSVMVSLALGLGLGAALALLLEMLDDRVRAPEEIEQLSKLTTLGVIPRLPAGEEMDEALKDPKSSLMEAYRSLGTALQFSTGSGLPRSIAVTSTGPGEGKSTTAVAIARYFAQMGLKVLIADADLRRPTLHTKLKCHNTCGLSNYLTGAALPPELVQKTDHPNLAFMPSGPLPPNAADLLSGTRIYSLISTGVEVFDLIIFDSPPVLNITDAQLLASAAAATVFVVGAGEKAKGAIRSALNQLQLARVIPIGTVLTKFNPRQVGYGYAYDYGYGYGYGGEYSYKGATDGDNKTFEASGKSQEPHRLANQD
jgi:polysaccharide biosynthesis transport protein